MEQGPRRKYQISGGPRPLLVPPASATADVDTGAYRKRSVTYQGQRIGSETDRKVTGDKNPQPKAPNPTNGTTHMAAADPMLRVPPVAYGAGPSSPSVSFSTFCSRSARYSSRIPAAAFSHSFFRRSDSLVLPLAAFFSYFYFFVSITFFLILFSFFLVYHFFVCLIFSFFFSFEFFIIYKINVSIYQPFSYLLLNCWKIVYVRRSFSIYFFKILKFTVLFLFTFLKSFKNNFVHSQLLFTF